MPFLKMRIVPLRLKIAFTGFIILWMPAYWQHYGPANFLWFCDLANFLIAVALWTESPLLLSSQGISILVIQFLWIFDVMSRVLSGVHVFGGTEYMFDPMHPLRIRLLSLFHGVTPLLILWTLGRLGYDRRGWLLQTGIAWIVLPLCFFFTDPERNINWVRGLFGKPQALVDPGLYCIALMIGYPLVIYLPSHLLLSRLFSSQDM